MPTTGCYISTTSIHVCVCVCKFIYVKGKTGMINGSALFGKQRIASSAIRSCRPFSSVDLRINVRMHSGTTNLLDSHSHWPLQFKNRDLQRFQQNQLAHGPTHQSIMCSCARRRILATPPRHVALAGQPTFDRSLSKQMPVPQRWTNNFVSAYKLYVSLPLCEETRAQEPRQVRPAWS